MQRYVVVKSHYSRQFPTQVYHNTRLWPLLLLSLFIVSSLAGGVSVSYARPTDDYTIDDSVVLYIVPVPVAEPVQEVVEEEVEATEFIWNVSAGNDDMLGNAATIVYFCTHEWYNAYDWLCRNYSPKWPYGAPGEANPRRNLSATMSIAIAVNAVRESGANPSAIEGGGKPSYTDEHHKALGLFQVDGGIRHNYLRFADALDKPYDDLETQLYFLAYSYYSYGAGFYARWQGSIERHQDLELSLNNVISAAESFRINWECGGTEGHNKSILKDWGNKWSADYGEKPHGGLYAYCIALI